MARTESPPFDRGATLGVSAVGIEKNYEGKEFWFEDLDLNARKGTGAAPARTGRYVKVRVVRNVSGFAISAKRVVALSTADGVDSSGRVNGYCATTAQQQCFPVDEFLPSAGCADKDLCFVVTEGPAMVTTPLAADATDVVNVGDALVAATGATTGATTAGRAGAQDLTGATSVLGKQIQNRIGRALSAATTANTGVDLLVDVGKW